LRIAVLSLALQVPRAAPASNVVETAARSIFASAGSGSPDTFETAIADGPASTSAFRRSTSSRYAVPETSQESELEIGGFQRFKRN